MSGKTTILPGKEEMLKRLLAVYDDDYTRERFYEPHLLPNAGRRLNAGGVATMFMIEIHGTIASGWSGAASLHWLVPDWIDALVNDPEVAEAAKEYHRKYVGAASKGQ